MKSFVSAISFLWLVVFVSSHNSIVEKFRDFEIVPDVVDTAPTKLIEITYASGVEVDLGNELTPTEVKDKPTLKWDADENAFYTLIMCDPDAPSRANPTIREVRHWYVVNIPGNNVSEGETLFDFIGSGPPKDTGLHRYVFFIFKQPGQLEFDEPRVSNKSREQRLNSFTKTFAKKYSLGAPIAGNFYQAQYDDYVPILHAQLSSGRK